MAFGLGRKQPQKVGLVMPGGGARAAYQVGVLKAIAELNTADTTPFPILCGTSAGAINAVGLASREENFLDACLWLENLWLSLQTQKIYRSDWRGVIKNAWRLGVSLVNSGIAVGRPVGLLDNQPLKKLLSGEINFSAIGRNVEQKRLSAVAVTAMNYTRRISETFYQGEADDIDWQRWRREGVQTPLELRHLMASTAIPTIFPPQRIGRNYYGDGALRQLSPISPALHLGSDKVMIITPTAHLRNYETEQGRVHSPAFGEIIGHLLNSAFYDSLESDIEMLEKMNKLVELTRKQITNPEGRRLKPIDSMVISPSKDIDQIAGEHTLDLPRSIRTLLRSSGKSSTRSGVNVASYLLFSSDFCRALIELGYQDGMEQSEEICAFLNLEQQEPQSRIFSSKQ